MITHSPIMQLAFLSTPSARRATREAADELDKLTDFYPRPPRGGRHEEDLQYTDMLNISIHALREEGDFFREQHLCRAEFLSTPSARRATTIVISFWQRKTISIHALREEGDSTS